MHDPYLDHHHLEFGALPIWLRVASGVLAAAIVGVIVVQAFGTLAIA